MGSPQTHPAARRSGVRSSRLVPVLGACILAVVLGACSGATQAPLAPAASAQPAGFAAAPANPAAQSEGGVDRGPVPAPDAGGNGALTAASTPSGTDQALIVETGSIQLEVRSLDVSLLKARAAIEALGGYVSASDQSNRGEQQIAVVTYRVPAAHWNAALDGLRPLATRVVAEKTQAVEVTGQVLDLGARIDNLRVTERALQAIMARATKISDVLDVQAQLTSVQGQIEQLSAQKAHLEQQAALGTLTVTFAVPVVAVAAATAGWNPGRQLDSATAQLVEIAQLLASVAIWLGVVALPLVLLLLLILGPLALFMRRLLPHRAPAGPPESA